MREIELKYCHGITFSVASALTEIFLNTCDEKKINTQSKGFVMTGDGIIFNLQEVTKKCQHLEKKSTGLFSNFKDGEVVPGIGIVRKIIKN